MRGWMLGRESVRLGDELPFRAGLRVAFRVFAARVFLRVDDFLRALAFDPERFFELFVFFFLAGIFAVYHPAISLR